jgi:hypothetical protein
MIITGVLAALFGCCGLFSCIGGIGTLAGMGTYSATGLDGSSVAGTTPPEYGIVGICFSIIFIAIPVIAYFLLVHNKPATPPAAPPM